MNCWLSVQPGAQIQSGAHLKIISERKRASSFTVSSPTSHARPTQHTYDDLNLITALPYVVDEHGADDVVELSVNLLLKIESTGDDVLKLVLQTNSFFRRSLRRDPRTG